MAYNIWKQEDLSFTLDEDMSSDGIVTIEVTTPDGVIMVMGAVAGGGRDLRAEGVHISSQGITPNSIGIRNLRLIATIIMDGMGYDSIRIQGAVRTTGANPSHAPHPIRFTRDRHDPDRT